MHATERWRNVTRTLMAHLAGITFGLSVTVAIVPLDDAAFNSQNASAFVRATYRDLGGVFAGVRSGRKTYRHTVQGVVECYARTPQDGAAGSVDTAEHIAEMVAARFTLADVTLLDYVADTSGATATTSVLRFIDAPEIAAPSPMDGWARRIVTFTGLWWPEHE